MRDVYSYAVSVQMGRDRMNGSKKKEWKSERERMKENIRKQSDDVWVK